MIKGYEELIKSRIEDLESKSCARNVKNIGYYISEDLEVSKSSNCIFQQYMFEHPHSKEQIEIKQLIVDNYYDIVWFDTREEAVGKLKDLLNNILLRYN